MTDRYDDAKRALADVPAPDLWGDAERRAAGDGAVVPLAPVGRRRRRPGRWAAAAAVVALVAGTVAVLAGGRDEGIDTGTGSTVSTTGDPAIYQADGGCKLGITGEPLPDPAAVSPAETHVLDDAGQPAVGTLVSGNLNSTQAYAVQVPGQVVLDLVGERVEDVQLRRGTAQLWFQSSGAVQLRWFTGGQEVCESYTVTVDGGTEDENRHAAVDLGERVLMPSELAGCCEDPPRPRIDGVWYLQAASKDGRTDPEHHPLRFEFRGGHATWTDGCKDLTSTYDFSGRSLLLGRATSSEGECLATITSDAVTSVMDGEARVDFDGPLLLLSSEDAQLRLRPADDGADATASALTGTWRIVALSDGGRSVPLPDPAAPVGSLEVELGPATIGWGDGCNGSGGDVEYTDEGFRVLESMQTLIGCPDRAGTDLIDGVVGSDEEVIATVDGDHLTLRQGEQVVELERA
jgi:heat shock protein HslJ